MQPAITNRGKNAAEGNKATAFRGRPWIFLVTLLPVSVFGAAGDRAGGDQAEPPEDAGTIELIITAPATVAVIEHSGPYWTIGPVMRQVREYMDEHGAGGAMFVRYLKDPTVRGTVNVRAEVGFFVEGDYMPQPPMTLDRWSAERAARMVVRGRATNPWRDYGVIQRWLKENGHQAAGPITEIYRPAASARPHDQRETEILVSLTGPVVERGPEAGDVVSEVAVKEADAPPELNDVLEAITTWFPENADHDAQALPQVETAKAAEAANEVTAESEKRTLRAQSEPGDGDSATGRKLDARSQLAESFAAGDFEEVAEILMPGNRPPPPGMQVWLGQVIYRLGAACKGLSEFFPEDACSLVPLCDALTRRYETIMDQDGDDPLGQAIVRIDVHNDPLAEPKRQVLRSVDRLLGEIATRRIEPGQAKDRFERILFELHGVLDEASGGGGR